MTTKLPCKSKIRFSKGEDISYYPRYHAFFKRKCTEYGNKFSDAGISKKFLVYFESGERIKVKAPWGEVLHGTVGITTGWKPTFLLMQRSNQMGSSITLDDRYMILGEKSGSKYRMFTQPK